jgi:proteasome accessory factor A
LSWLSPEIRHLDQMYAAVDEAEGLFWSCERAGLLDPVVTGDQVALARNQPPDDTRAWTRAHLLRRLTDVRYVDWDRLEFRTPAAADSRLWWTTQAVQLPCPFRATKADHEALFTAGRTIDDIVSRLGAQSVATAASTALARYPTG